MLQLVVAVGNEATKARLEANLLALLPVPATFLVHV
jgi:hypothetical protein